MVSVAGNLMMRDSITHEAHVAEHAGPEEKSGAQGTLADALRIDEPVAMAGETRSGARFGFDTGGTPFAHAPPRGALRSLSPTRHPLNEATLAPSRPLPL